MDYSISACDAACSALTLFSGAPYAKRNWNSNNKFLAIIDCIPVVGLIAMLIQCCATKCFRKSCPHSSIFTSPAPLPDQIRISLSGSRNLSSSIEPPPPNLEQQNGSMDQKPSPPAPLTPPASPLNDRMHQLTEKEKLNDNLQIEICSFLNVQDKINLLQVNHEWKKNVLKSLQEQANHEIAPSLAIIINQLDETIHATTIVSLRSALHIPVSNAVEQPHMEAIIIQLKNLPTDILKNMISNEEVIKNKLSRKIIELSFLYQEIDTLNAKPESKDYKKSDKLYEIIKKLILYNCVDKAIQVADTVEDSEYKNRSFGKIMKKLIKLNLMNRAINYLINGANKPNTVIREVTLALSQRNQYKTIIYIFDLLILRNSDNENDRMSDVMGEIIRQALQMSGDVDSAYMIIDTLKKLSTSYPSITWRVNQGLQDIALYYAKKGQRDKAIETANQITEDQTIKNYTINCIDNIIKK